MLPGKIYIKRRDAKRKVSNITRINKLNSEPK